MDLNDNQINDQINDQMDYQLEYHIVADDNDINRMVIKILLESYGYKILEAENGIEVLNLLNDNTHKFKFIWLDVEMPIMDGIECSKKIKEELNYDGTVVAITSHADNESLDECYKSGMDAALTKPITKESLCEIIKKFKQS